MSKVFNIVVNSSNQTSANLDITGNLMSSANEVKAIPYINYPEFFNTDILNVNYDGDVYVAKKIYDYTLDGSPISVYAFFIHKENEEINRSAILSLIGNYQGYACIGSLVITII